MVQWLRLHAPTAGGTGSIPGRGTKTPHAAQYGQKKKENYSCEKRHEGDPIKATGAGKASQKKQHPRCAEWVGVNQAEGRGRTGGEPLH